MVTRTWICGLTALSLVALAQTAAAQTHGRNNSPVPQLGSSGGPREAPPPHIKSHYRTCWRHHHQYYDHHCPAPHHHDAH